MLVSASTPTAWWAIVGAYTGTSTHTPSYYKVYTSIRQVHRYMYINQVVDVYSVVTTHDSDKKTVTATPNAV